MPTAVELEAAVEVEVFVIRLVDALASVVKPALKPLRSKIPAAYMLRPPLLVKALLDPAFNDPAPTVVSPV